MTRYLADTHAFVWYILNDARLSPTARAIISDPESEIFLSAASVWEMGIKASLGKLSITTGNFAEFVQEQISENNIQILPIEVAHVGIQVGLPHHHKDPFDRLIAAQGFAEGYCDNLSRYRI